MSLEIKSLYQIYIIYYIYMYSVCLFCIQYILISRCNYKNIIYIIQ